MEKEKQEESKGIITLEEGRDMTYTKFIEWLNENFEKSSGAAFNAQDVYGYISRGNLPYHFGVYKVKETDYPKIGVKIITITDLSKK